MSVVVYTLIISLAQINCFCFRRQEISNAVLATLTTDIKPRMHQLSRKMKTKTMKKEWGYTVQFDVFAITGPTNV